MDARPTKHFIVGTAGHVDHGKTSLVRALTGTDPDRLPEEKARGITIDLGFAHLELPGMQVGVVDVPGHEDFVKNMVSGVGAVDLALFVVAADDGWMPQTEEHLQILTYLGVRRAVVALTKIDLAEDEAAAIAAVRARLENSPFAGAPIVPTAAGRGRGIPELRAALTAALAGLPPSPDLGKPRLPVDRVFALRGVGTVLTGTLTGGNLARGQAVVTQPSGRSGHVRGVQNHGRETESTSPGTRTALNVPDWTASGEAAVARGEVVTLAELGGASRTLDVLLKISSREATLFGAVTTRALRNGKTVRLHLGSSHWTARVSLLERGELLPGGQSVARLRCERPVFALAGDRFVLRDGAGRCTIAGGVVLDPEAERQRRFRRGPQPRFLLSLSTGGQEDDPAAVLLATLARDRALPRSTLLRRWPFHAARVDAIATHLIGENRAVGVGDYLVDAGSWTEWQTKAAALVDAEHRVAPDRIGLPLVRLRTGLARELPMPGLLDELVQAMTGRGEFIRIGASLRRDTHRPTLPPHLQAAGERLRTELARLPFEPPNRKLLTPDGPSRQALRFLFDTGEALEFGEEVVLLEASFRRMRSIITRTLRAVGPSTASDLRQVLGTTRRVLIPVLERLDRDGVTRREGDRRMLR